MTLQLRRAARRGATRLLGRRRRVPGLELELERRRCVPGLELVPGRRVLGLELGGGLLARCLPLLLQRFASPDARVRAPALPVSAVISTGPSVSFRIASRQSVRHESNEHFARIGDPAKARTLTVRVTSLPVGPDPPPPPPYSPPGQGRSRPPPRRGGNPPSDTVAPLVRGPAIPLLLLADAAPSAALRGPRVDRRATRAAAHGLPSVSATMEFFWASARSSLTARGWAPSMSASSRTCCPSTASPATTTWEIRRLSTRR